MNIVIPMAGRGSRFADCGIETPKPLIDVRGLPMYSWAVDSLPLAQAERLIFVCLAEHLDAHPLGEDIASRYAALNPEIVALDRVTEGQACTVLLAGDAIDSDRPLLIFNSDTVLRDGMAERLAQRPLPFDGLFSVSRARGDKWSFARADAEGRVLETAEKRRISEWASTGLYHFTRGRDFVRHARAMIAAGERSRGEYYVAPVYNRLIAEGLDIRLDLAREVWPLGTPEDLAAFEAGYPS